MNIDSLQMQTFLTVIREQNFRRAAKILNVSQPTVTLRIKALEESIGSKLVNRNDHQLTLTPSGEVVLKYFEKMLFVLQEVNDHLSSLPSSTDRISIAAIPSFSTYAFPVLLQQKSFFGEQLQFTIQNVSSTKVLQLVMDGAVDFGIMRGPIKDNGNIRSILLYDEKIFLATPIGHKLNKKKEVFVKDLLNESIITFERRFWSLFANQVLEQGLTFDKKMVVDSEITAKKFVAFKLGVTILPEFSIKISDYAEISTKEITDFKITRTTYLVFRKDSNQYIVDRFYNWVHGSLHRGINNKNINPT